MAGGSPYHFDYDYDDDYAHEHEGTRGWGSSITRYDYDDDYGRERLMGW